MDVGYDWQTGTYGAYVDAEARLAGAVDIVGSYSAMRWATYEQRKLVANCAIEVFDEMTIANGGQRPGDREYEMKVLDKIQTNAATEDYGFIWMLLLQVFISFIVQKILEWLWANRTQEG